MTAGRRSCFLRPLAEIRCAESFCTWKCRLQVKADLLDHALCRLRTAASEDLAQNEKQNHIHQYLPSAAGASSPILLVAYKVHKVIVIHF